MGEYAGPTVSNLPQKLASENNDNIGDGRDDRWDKLYEAPTNRQEADSCECIERARSHRNLVRLFAKRTWVEILEWNILA